MGTTFRGFVCATASAVAGAVALGACLTTGAQQPPNKEASVSTQKEQAKDLLKSIETGDPKPASVINPKKYIQHNLAVADGIEGFAALLKLLPKGLAKVNTIRVFQDGAFVFAHTDYDFFGPKIGIDVFRFEDGKIVEHWDNLQEKPSKRNPSGHTMLDGPTDVKDLSKTAQNKKLVGEFVQDILVNGKLDKLTNYIDGDNYAQHNPQIGDGLSGLGKALEALAKAGITMKYDEVHKVLGEGNFVLAASQGKFGGKHTAFFDLCRVDNGKIVEHWDTIESIPDKKDWKNSNGKF